MLFSDIKKILSDAKVVGNLPKKKIKYITDHSKKAEPNVLLVIDKNKKFKLNYLEDAKSKKLTAIISNNYLKNISITQVIVKNLSKDVLTLLKHRQQYQPKISVAITGTNGKTSTAWYLAQICKITKIPTKLIGTLGYFKNLKKIKNSDLTTPSNLDLYQFACLKTKNQNCLISEASSHGLHQGRFNNINIDIAAITNLSHDHLDYHKNFQAYVKSKFSLFTKNLNKKGIAVINYRLKNYKILEKKLLLKKIKIITFGSKDIYFSKKIDSNLIIYKKSYQIKKSKFK